VFLTGPWRVKQENNKHLTDLLLKRSPYFIGLSVINRFITVCINAIPDKLVKYRVSVELKTIPVNNFFELGRKFRLRKLLPIFTGIPTESKVEKKKFLFETRNMKKIYPTKFVSYRNF
jgi:hypothetical protein